MIDYANDIRLHLILSIITRIQTDDLDSEAKKQQFIYDLAKLNSLATKGYMAERTAMDDSIYAIKQLACEYIATHWPSRCRYDSGYSCTSHSSVLYIYVKSRQYSFHVDLSDSIVTNKGRFDEWDRIEGGWQLSDEEYRTVRSARRCYSYSLPIVRTQKSRKLAAMYFAAANDYIRRRDSYNRYHDQAYTKYWSELETVLPAKKKKNKCFMTKNFSACYERYFSMVEKSFSDPEKRIFRGYPDFDYYTVETIRRNSSDGISFPASSTVENKLKDIVKLIDDGSFSTEKLYTITKVYYVQ